MSEQQNWKKSRTLRLIHFKNKWEQVANKFKDLAPGPQREGGLRPLALGLPGKCSQPCCRGLGSRGSAWKRQLPMGSHYHKYQKKGKKKIKATAWRTRIITLDVKKSICVELKILINIFPWKVCLQIHFCFGKNSNNKCPRHLLYDMHFIHVLSLFLLPLLCPFYW